jgi:hypothetical protein
MNALARTFDGFTRALIVATQDRPVSDLLAWERRQYPRPYPTLRLALEHYHVMDDESDRLSKVKTRLEALIRREKMKAQMGHWSFDANRMAAYAAIKSTIEAFEAR